MTPEDVAKVATQAGFKQALPDGPVRTAFTRGSSTLIVYKDGKWSCYSSPRGGKRPNFSGDDSKSLLLFLMSEYLSEQNRSVGD